ncbi:MAG: DUF1553 domain-containing protein [Planctomycetaceae bacterium]|nr:DUF1553 domain-containing protein [Planctomycetaceae bacterium]
MTLALCLAAGIPATAAEPAVPAVSSPQNESVQTALAISPASVQLTGLRDRQQLLVSIRPDGAAENALADVTRQATFDSLEPSIALVSRSGLIVPRGQGEARIRVEYGGKSQVLNVTVDGIGAAEQVDFRTEVIAALSRAGCSQGSCHGAPQGKNGFRLSLRGYDPDLDFETLARETGGRRVNPFDPDQSLILRKGLGTVPHQGGVRFRQTDSSYQILRAWIQQGCRDQGRTRQLTGLEVLPGLRRLAEDYPQQQLVALATFDDGTVQDVTHLAVFSSSDENAATVTRDGLAEFSTTAEATILVRYLDQFASSRLMWVRHNPEYRFEGPLAAGLIDEHIFARQRQMQVQPAALANDAVFLRRACLDTIGTLPTAEEARRFLDSTDPDKRSQLIDRLLERDEYALFWALKWADIMRGSEVTISRRGVFSFHRYLVQQFREDRPFNEFARETLTSLGNTLHRPEASFFRVARTPEEMAEAASQLFLGVRIGCAKCHNHPFESITQDDYYGLAACFARVKFKGKQFGLDDEVVYLDQRSEVRHPRTNTNVVPAMFGVVQEELAAGEDRREQLASWLTAADNRWFARSNVNRMWFHLFGRGIVEPVDDFRETNPPSHPELLDALAEEFVRGGYRFRPVLRMILNSQAYQLGYEAPAPIAGAAESTKYFAKAQVQMLTGEQLLDAVSLATGVPARFEGYPVGTRAIELAEGAVDHPFLQAFSKPVRDVTCECARDGDPSIGQVIHLLNNPEIQQAFRAPEGRLTGWIRADKSDAEIVELLYLSTLSRRPTSAETKLVQQHLAQSEERAAGLADIQHALINSHEFLLRH